MASSKKQPVFPARGAKPIGPYSPAVRTGNFLFTSGQIGLDPQTGKLVSEGVETEARQALTNLKLLVEAGGFSLDMVVKTTLYLTNIADFAAVNGVYAEFFPSEPPARSTVQVSALPAGASIEIEAIAAL
ncbi:MAG TPA: Rid family detoxifying hydrolase [Anaerolineales bacterium]|nr:Rid family detoxifying hydrolase [Anaerolineales bacterium]